MYGHFIPPFFPPFPFMLPLLIVLAVWSLIIKGFALWKAARNSHKAWYIVLLVVNSIGILEIIYLVWFAKKDALVASSSAPESL